FIADDSKLHKIGQKINIANATQALDVTRILVEASKQLER
ncbi:uncharacterized protein METZ01_LOCUS489689, partial [marine metagenome]